jgi:hypothetical protein
MTTTTQKTRVIMRRFCGEVIALFPDIDEGRGLCLSYMRIVQHSPASRSLTRDTPQLKEG